MKKFLVGLFLLSSCATNRADVTAEVERHYKETIKVNCFLYLHPNNRLDEFGDCVKTLGGYSKQFIIVNKNLDK